MKISPILLFAFLTVLSSEVQAQCRTFVKNNCKEAMGDYVASESFNATKLVSGDEAELQMTFSQGEDYRLLVCHQSILPSVAFQILDTDRNVLFDNTAQEMSQHFDFRVPGTQELIVTLKVAESNNKNMSPQGCVAIIVGKKIR